MSRGRPACKVPTTPKLTEQPGGESPRTATVPQGCEEESRARDFHEATKGLQVPHESESPTAP